MSFDPYIQFCEEWLEWWATPPDQRPQHPFEIWDCTCEYPKDASDYDGLDMRLRRFARQWMQTYKAITKGNLLVPGVSKPKFVIQWWGFGQDAVSVRVEEWFNNDFDDVDERFVRPHELLTGEYSKFALAEMLRIEPYLIELPPDPQYADDTLHKRLLRKYLGAMYGNMPQQKNIAPYMFNTAVLVAQERAGMPPNVDEDEPIHVKAHHFPERTLLLPEEAKWANEFWDLIEQVLPGAITHDGYRIVKVKPSEHLTNTEVSMIDVAAGSAVTATVDLIHIITGGLVDLATLQERIEDYTDEVINKVPLFKPRVARHLLGPDLPVSNSDRFENYDDVEFDITKALDVNPQHRPRRYERIVNQVARRMHKVLPGVLDITDFGRGPMLPAHPDERDENKQPYGKSEPIFSTYGLRRALRDNKNRHAIRAAGIRQTFGQLGKAFGPIPKDLPPEVENAIYVFADAATKEREKKERVRHHKALKESGLHRVRVGVGEYKYVPTATRKFKRYAGTNPGEPARKQPSGMPKSSQELFENYREWLKWWATPADQRGNPPPVKSINDDAFAYYIEYDMFSKLEQKQMTDFRMLLQCILPEQILGDRYWITQVKSYPGSFTIDILAKDLETDMIESQNGDILEYMSGQKIPLQTLLELEKEVS